MKTQPLPFRLGLQFRDSDDIMDLFALVLDLAESERRKGKYFEVPFARLWKRSLQPLPLTQFSSVSQQCLTNGTCVGAGDLTCPQKASGRASAWKIRLPGLSFVFRKRKPEGMVQSLVEYCLGSAEKLNVEDGATLFRILAAVGQTLNSENDKFVFLNREIAQQRLQAAKRRMAARPGLPAAMATRQGTAKLRTSGFLVSKRRDEVGDCLKFGPLAIWHASYNGPRCGQKTENQDATAADCFPEKATFALADGVGTSLGSRAAAAAFVRRFCDFPPNTRRWAECLPKDSIYALSEWMDEVLSQLLADPLSEDFKEVCGENFQRAAAIRLLDNTRTGHSLSMPAALTATLIGGIVRCTSDPARFEVDLLRVGDGLAERVTRDGTITPVLEMDPNETKISVAMGPGPLAREGLRRPGAITGRTITLQEGEFLLISSDGLARGHQTSVAQQLKDLLGRDILSNFQPEDTASSLRILQAASERADELYEKTSGQTCLFGDNLSLIVISSLGSTRS